MVKTSSGILIYKFDQEKKLRVFLVHPGGPFWKDKDEGAWSIPKGEVEENDKGMLKVAKRELKEESGIDLSAKREDEFIYLGEIKQKSGKIVHCFVIEGDWTGLLICKSYTEVEWPYKSGKMINVPEVDKAGFFKMEEARKKMIVAQREFLDRLMEKIKTN